MTSASSPTASRSTVRVMCWVYFGFAMPIAMLGVAWPSIRDELGRSNGALGILATSYGIGRLVMSGTGGLQLRRRRFGAAVGLAVAVLGLASLSVAVAPSWPVLLAAVLLTGLASGSIDALGGRLIAGMRSVKAGGLLAGSYGVGATVGPAIVALGDRWRWAYAITGAVALVGAALVVRPTLQWPVGLEPTLRTDSDAATRPPLRSPAVLVSVLLMVCFVGAEVTIGSWTATFLEDAREIEGWVAGLAVSGFWAGATIGRLALSAIAVGARHLLALAAVVAFGVASLTVLPGVTVIAGSVVIGLALAPFFPVIMATTGDRVGLDDAPQVSGWQLVAGNIGGTSIPALTGVAVSLTDEWAIVWMSLAVCAVGGVVLSWERHLRVAPVGTPVVSEAPG